MVDIQQCKEILVEAPFKGYAVTISALNNMLPHVHSEMIRGGDGDAVENMDEYLRIVHYALGQTSERDQELVYTKCVKLLMRDLKDTYSSLHNEGRELADSIEGIYTEMPIGPAKLAVETYVRQMDMYTAWCDRASCMFEEVTKLKVDEGDTPWRMVDRTYHLLAGALKLPGSTPNWQELVNGALWQNMGADEPEEEILETLDGFIEEYRIHCGPIARRELDDSPYYNLQPELLGLFDAMRVGYKLVAELETDPSEERRKFAVAAAAKGYIRDFKKQFARKMVRTAIRIYVNTRRVALYWQERAAMTAFKASIGADGRAVMEGPQAKRLLKEFANGKLASKKLRVK